MAETDRLGYSRGVLDELRATHEQSSRDELLDLVCHLTKTYVLDQTIPYDFPLPERADELRADPPDAPLAPNEVAHGEAAPGEPGDAPERQFARLIEGLKRRTQLPQFEAFSVEDGRVVLVVDNQKVTFGERVTVEFVPLRQAPRRSGDTGALPVPQPPEAAAPTPAPARPTPAPARPTPPPARPTPPRSGPPRPATPPRPTHPPPARKPEEEPYDASVERFRRLDLD